MKASDPYTLSSLDDPKREAFEKARNYPLYDKELEPLIAAVVEECARIADSEVSNPAGCGYITKTAGMRIREHFRLK